MRKLIGGAVAALLLSACGGGETEADNSVSEAAASALQPGEYELVAKVDDLRSTDKTTPATKLKMGGEPVITRACIGAANAIPPTAFAAAGETCEAGENYVRNGRLSLQLRCNQPGKGSITHTVDGKFKADSLEATVTSGTYFSGTGDYAMVRSFTGRRVGECAAKAG